MNQSSPNPIKIVCENRRAKFDYQLSERVEMGLVLTGSEVKSLRQGHAHLTDAYADVRHGELYLVQSEIAPYERAGYSNHEPKRPRKLLVKRKDLDRLVGLVQTKGVTLVPLKLYFKKGWAKVEIAVAVGKKLHDKRETIKARDVARHLQTTMKRRK